MAVPPYDEGATRVLDAEDLAEHHFSLEHPEPPRIGRGAEAWQRRHQPGAERALREEAANARRKRGWWARHKAGTRRVLGCRRHQGRRTPRPASNRRAQSARAAATGVGPEPPPPGLLRRAGGGVSVTPQVTR